MKVFLSHSHRAKAFVRAIRSYLSGIYIGVDGQYELLIVADINVPIRNAIHEEADFMIIFLGREALKSEWIWREFEGALERDKQIKGVRPPSSALLKLNA